MNAAVAMPDVSMIPERVRAALAEGDRWGMEQHGDEIWPCAALVLDEKPKNVLEIGFRRGGTLALWHELSTGIAIGVDLPDGFSRDRAVELRRVYPRLVTVLGDSHSAGTFAQVYEALRGERLDFLFIDGDHSAEGVREDFETYGSLVRKGGLIAFHDIQPNPATRGVHALWQELKPGSLAEFNIGGEWGGIGVIRA